MNENEPKLDGYEPMNMEQNKVEVMEPSPVPTASIDTLDLGTPSPETLSTDNGVSQAVVETPTPSVGIGEPISLGNSDGTQINQTVSLEQTPNLGETATVATPAMSPADSVSSPAAPTFFQNTVENNNELSSNPAMAQTTAAPINTPVDNAPVDDKAKKKSKLPLILIIVLVLVVVGVGVYFLFFRKVTNPYTITTTIFDELASSTTETYGDFSELLNPTSGKPVQTKADLYLDYCGDEISGSLTTVIDVNNNLLSLNSTFGDDGSSYELNGLISKDALYFNTDSIFGNNYKYSYDFSEIFEDFSDNEESERVVKMLINSVKNAFTATFTEDDFTSSKDGDYDKYHLVITAEDQYNIVNLVVTDFKNDEYIKGIIENTLKEEAELFGEEYDSSEYDSYFEIDKAEFIKGREAIYYDLYMDKLELKKIKLSDDGSFEASISYDGDKTTTYIKLTSDSVDDVMDSMPVSRLLANGNDEEEVSSVELAIVNSSSNLNISLKVSDGELVFDWKKGSKYSFSIVEDGKTTELVSGTLKVENTVNHSLFDLTFTVKPLNEDYDDISGTFKIESKQLDKFSSSIPSNALDLEDEENTSKAIDDLSKLPVLSSILTTDTDYNYDFDDDYDYDDDSYWN